MKIQALLQIVTMLLVLTTLFALSECANKPVKSARKEDIPFIKCQVCEKVASEIYNQVKSKQSQIAPKKITEYQIIEIAENVCNLKKAEADWIMKIDIVEQGDKLELVEQDVEGQCNSECKTIEKACQEVVGYSDTDIAEYIYSSKPQLDSLVNYFCKDLTKSCSKNPPPVPKDRLPGEPFMPKPAKEAEMEKLMRSMEGMPGAPGMSMYSREELMNGFNKGGADDDDEDDDDETNFPSNLGKVLRQKEKPKADWKEKITKGITTASENLKKHANKMSYRIQQWWKGMKAGNKKKKSKSGKSEL